MKIRSWHVVVLAIIVFVLDFLTLGNRQVIDNPISNPIAAVIGLLCVLVAIFGAMKTLHDFLSRNREANKNSREQEEEQGIRATGVEIGLRRLLAILLIMTALPIVVLVPFLGLILELPTLLLALYLLLNRRYHLALDCLLVFLGCLGYFVSFSLGSFSLGPSYFSLYRLVALYACPGLINPIRPVIDSAGLLALTRLFPLLASLFLLAGDIITRLKTAHKRRLNAVSLVVIVLVLVSLPFLFVPRVALGQATGGGTGSSSGMEPSHFGTSNASYHMSYDRAFDTYTFTAEMVNQDSNNPASITNICVDGRIIPITEENSMLQVDNGVIADGDISVAPGQTATIKLISPKPFYVVRLLEGGYSYSTSFLR